LIVLPIAVKVVMTVAILALVLAALLKRPSPAFDGRIVATLVVATFAFVETVTYAHFKVDGPQNWTYPIPFGNSNYMDVLPSMMQPPDEKKLAAFADKLEVENFRSILVSQPTFYAITPHISQFWRARLVGGYGTGVPERLAGLPWPEGVRTLRIAAARRRIHPSGHHGAHGGRQASRERRRARTDLWAGSASIPQGRVHSFS